MKEIVATLWLHTNVIPLFNYLLVIPFLFGLISPSQAQNENNGVFRKKCYFTWGYTRAAYSQSTIRFTNLSNKYNQATGRNDYYDFTLHNVVAHDRPDFKSIRDVANPTIPQYVFRIGYSFSKKWDIELN